jgi:Flp pilus assembly protein TadB
MTPLGPGPRDLAAAVAAGVAALAWIPPSVRWPTVARQRILAVEDPGWLHRRRWLWCLLAGLGGATFVSGPGAPIAAVAAAVATWLWIGRTEPAPRRRRREAIERELPMLVQLLVTALESGRDVTEAVRLVCEALPGPGGQLLEGVPSRLALGVTPEVAWRPVLDLPELAPLARAMIRAHSSGSSVTEEASRLGDDLERRARMRVEERARSVGVKAAVPLGLCLLPSFLLIGVVPLVAGLLASLSL